MCQHNISLSVSVQSLFIANVAGSLSSSALFLFDTDVVLFSLFLVILTLDSLQNVGSGHLDLNGNNESEVNY